MLAEINPIMLAEYMGTEFEVLDDPSRIFCLTLTNILEHVKTDHQAAFSLFFHGPRDPFIPQGIHNLKHARLGELEIFLVPVAEDKEGFQYEAVFNHIF